MRPSQQSSITCRKSHRVDRKQQHNTHTTTHMHHTHAKPHASSRRIHVATYAKTQDVASNVQRFARLNSNTTATTHRHIHVHTLLAANLDTHWHCFPFCAEWLATDIPYTKHNTNLSGDRKAEASRLDRTWMPGSQCEGY